MDVGWKVKSEKRKVKSGIPMAMGEKLKVESGKWKVESEKRNTDGCRVKMEIGHFDTV
jgi:hypothetical protein